MTLSARRNRLQKWLGIAFIFCAGIVAPLGMTCGDRARVDEVKNKGVELLCNASTFEAIFKIDKDAGREYNCLCQQAAKQSDQNLCRSIVNINDSKAILTACAAFIEDRQNQKCVDLFTRIK
jgi:hypothetical protein